MNGNNSLKVILVLNYCIFRLRNEIFISEFHLEYHHYNLVLQSDLNLRTSAF